MFLRFTHAHYVEHSPSMKLEPVRNHRPVTTPPQSLGAHVSRSFIGRNILKLMDGYRKRWSLHIISIASESRMMSVRIC